jgi:hypothetical protein
MSDDNWRAFMDDVQQALETFAVPAVEQADLKTIVESTKEAIVVAAFQEGV